MATISSLSRLTFCQYSREEPAFCTILPFYFACQLIIFTPNYPLLAPKIPLFRGCFALFGHVFHVYKRLYLYHCGVFLCFLARI